MRRFVEIGDGVRLNSGGPLMKIVEIKEDGQIVCEWMGCSSLPDLMLPNRSSFPIEALTVVSV